MIFYPLCRFKRNISK